MGKPYSCMQFIKSCIFYYKSCENPYQDYKLASFPGPRPASCRLQYGKAGEGLVHFLT